MNPAAPDRRPQATRRALLGALVAGPAIAAVCGPLRAAAPAGRPPIRVWTGLNCGCCRDWVTYLEANGFDVTASEGGNSEARARLGMPVRFGSCHTAEIEGYAIEGHVPVREIHRLLDEQPDAIGISVPAMPRGSPGMDGPAYGDILDPYDVLLIDRNGEARVFAAYRP